MKKVKRHFEPMGDKAFRSYWFEMWTFYESKHGPAWTWEPRYHGENVHSAAEVTNPTRERGRTVFILRNIK